MNRIYVDNAATTKIEDRVFEAMLPYLKEEYGNASSIYSLGKNAKSAIEKARVQVAKVLNCDTNEIIFTGSGTEANNMVLNCVKKGHIITSKIEHPAILETCKHLEKQGVKVTYINVDEDGTVDFDELKNSIREDTTLISIMFANNEIGTIQPIKEIGEFAKKHNILFHTDAVQAVGNIDIDVKKLNIDLLTLSAHKFNGPKGVGALYIKKGTKLTPFIHGGHQENNKRAGTENVAGIVGLGASIELAYKDISAHNKHLLSLRDYYFEQIKKRIPHIKINGHLKNRLPGNANISFRFIEGEGILLGLDQKGVCASSGSACTSGSLDPSHVLLAIGLSHELAHGSLRVTFGKYNTKEEVDYVVNELEMIIKNLRNMSPLYEKFLEEEK